MWPFRKKKDKRTEQITQFLYGIGIALVIFNLPIFLRAHLSISVNESMAVIVIGIVFLLAGLVINLKK